MTSVSDFVSGQTRVVEFDMDLTDTWSQAQMYLVGSVLVRVRLVEFGFYTPKNVKICVAFINELSE